jgi:hypothetical protein
MQSHHFQSSSEDAVSPLSGISYPSVRSVPDDSVSSKIPSLIEQQQRDLSRLATDTDNATCQTIIQNGKYGANLTKLKQWMIEHAWIASIYLDNPLIYKQQCKQLLDQHYAMMKWIERINGNDFANSMIKSDPNYSLRMQQLQNEFNQSKCCACMIM